MSNPVPPPGGYQPPAAQPGQPMPGQPVPAQQYPGQPVPAQQYPGQPVPGQNPGQAYPGQPVPGQQPPGFQPPADGQQFFELPAEVKKKSAKSRLLGIVGSIVVVLVVLGLKFGLASALNKDEAKEAKVGDCVAAKGDVPTEDGKETDTGAEVVDCADPKAKFTVVGRVEGETDTNSKSCDKYFTDENADYFVYARSGGVSSGYLLCLKQKA